MSEEQSEWDGMEAALEMAEGSAAAQALVEVAENHRRVLTAEYGQRVVR